MTVMTMKELIDFSDRVKDIEMPVSMDDVKERIKEIDAVMDYLGDSAESAKEIILKKITEEKLVDFMDSVSKTTVFGAITAGEGTGLMISMMNDELTGYTHSVILAVIGALINEEIL